MQVILDRKFLSHVYPLVRMKYVMFYMESDSQLEALESSEADCMCLLQQAKVLYILRMPVCLAIMIMHTISHTA